MIYAIIVVYNKYLKDSNTYNFFSSRKTPINLVIFDNSEEKFRIVNERICSDNNISYYTSNRNVGLSKAYNSAISKLKENSNVKYVIILDDDTTLTDSYITEVVGLVKEKKHDVFLPIVRAGNEIISPCELYLNIKYKKTKDVNRLNPNKLTAINSGMIVSMNVYQKISYDERLFLDDVDHLFMYFVNKNNFNVYVMKSEIFQNYSRNQKGSLESEKTRFKIWLKDHRNYCSIRHIMLFYHITTLKNRIRQFRKNDFNSFFLFYK